MSLQLLTPASGVGGLTTGRKKPALVGPVAALPSSIGAEMGLNEAWREVPSQAPERVALRVRVQLIGHL